MLLCNTDIYVFLQLFDDVCDNDSITVHVWSNMIKDLRVTDCDVVMNKVGNNLKQNIQINILSLCSLVWGNPIPIQGNLILPTSSVVVIFRTMKGIAVSGNVSN